MTENKTTIAELKQTLLTVKSKTTVDVKYSRKEHSARVSSLLRVYEQYERQLEGQVQRTLNRGYIPRVPYDNINRARVKLSSTVRVGVSSRCILTCTVPIRTTAVTR